jgi:hypothetical protein
MFLAYRELAKSAYEDVFPAFERLFDQLKDAFNNLGGFTPGEKVLCKEIFHNVCFGQCCHLFIPPGISVVLPD